MWRRIFGYRVQISVSLSAGILGSLFAVIAGSVCNITGTFNVVRSLIGPFYALYVLWYAVIPGVLILALIIVPFAPRRWERGNVIVVIAVPVIIYMVLGGYMAYLLYQHPYGGCF